MKKKKCCMEVDLGVLDEELEAIYGEKYHTVHKDQAIVFVSKDLITRNKREVIFIGEDFVRVGYIISFSDQREDIQEEIISYFNGDLFGVDALDIKDALNKSNNQIELFAEMIDWKEIYL